MSYSSVSQHTPHPVTYIFYMEKIFYLRYEQLPRVSMRRQILYDLEGDEVILRMSRTSLTRAYYRHRRLARTPLHHPNATCLH
jgi:hypothetical protein